MHKIGQSKLKAVLGTLPKYIALQLFFATYILSIFFKANVVSDSTYQPMITFYLLPLCMAMVFVHFGYQSIRTASRLDKHYWYSCAVLVFYIFVWLALFWETA